MAAVELGNASDTGLPPGVVTLYQQTGARGAVYLGDARLTALAVGDKRLLSFALDDKVTVDRTAPTVQVSIPSTTPSLAPQVRVTAQDLNSLTGAQVRLKNLYVRQIPKSGREPADVLNYLGIETKQVLAAV